MKEQPLVTPKAAIEASFGSVSNAKAWLREKIEFFLEHYGDTDSPRENSANHWVCVSIPPPSKLSRLWVPDSASSIDESTRYETVFLVRIDRQDKHASFGPYVFALVRKGAVLPLGGGYGLVGTDDILLVNKLQ